MQLIYFFISLFTSMIGAISGIGGGVILKPIMDSMGLLRLETINFLSGCTVLSMSIISVIDGVRKQRPHVKSERSTTLLAVGACIGGLAGKYLFLVFVKSFSEDIGFVIQACILLLINVVVFLYICNKDKFKSHHITSLSVAFMIGTSLGILSAFLGIGGGPVNIAILYYLFSMNAKEANHNSLYIIMFSQSTSLLLTIVGRSIPPFPFVILVLMLLGAVVGAFAGRKVLEKLCERKTALFFKYVVLFLVLLNVYNIVRYIFE